MNGADSAASAAFRAAFGRAPQWLARAPGRVNLIGEHTDYNGGFVLPMAIDRETRLIAATNGTRHAVLHSATLGERVTIDLDAPLAPRPRGEWANYPLGVIAGFAQATGARALDALPGFDALIETTVPVGSGLSSSAALEVATATLLEALTGRALDPRAKADLCRRAEHGYAGVPCGPMDQTISALGRDGHLLLFDCGSGAVEWVEFSDASIAVLVIDTRVRHSLADGEYAKRRAQCAAAAAKLGVGLLCEADLPRLEAIRCGLDPVLYRRARHVLGEQARTCEAASAIARRDWPAIGRAMYASHVSLRDDYEVSCAELDAVVDAARGIGPDGGVHGCRMTGGGFGGCAVALVDAARATSIGESVARIVSTRGLREPAWFVTRAAAGASCSGMQE